MLYDRRIDNKKHSRFFYMFAMSVFISIAFITFICSFISGFTDQRIAVIFLNLWFALFTMDLITVRFRRESEKAPWHEWSAFKRSDDKPQENHNHELMG